MENKIRQMILAFVLCISAFFMPVTAYAAGEADTTPPVIHAEVLDKVLHIEADDKDSGVDAVYINGKRINYQIKNMFLWRSKRIKFFAVPICGIVHYCSLPVWCKWFGNRFTERIFNLHRS